jgi:hypothetical protein
MSTDVAILAGVGLILLIAVVITLWRARGITAAARRANRHGNVWAAGTVGALGASIASPYYTGSSHDGWTGSGAAGWGGGAESGSPGWGGWGESCSDGGWGGANSCGESGGGGS